MRDLGVILFLLRALLAKYLGTPHTSSDIKHPKGAGENWP